MVKRFVLNKLILPGYSLSNTHMIQIAPTFHNYCPVSMILTFIPQTSILKVDKTRWIASCMTSYSSCRLQFMPTGKIMMRKCRNMTLNLTSTWQEMMHQIQI